jgi:hypothetical protein
VYDASQAGPNWWWLLIPGLLLSLIAAIWLQRERFRLPSPLEGFRAVVLVIASLFVVGCTGVAVASSISSYNAIAQLSAEDMQVVEGVVQDFTPQSPMDKGVESFTVSGVRFEYSSADLTPGYKQTSTHGGPINRNGLPVRIHYVTDAGTGRNTILKLEIGK